MRLEIEQLSWSWCEQHAVPMQTVHVVAALAAVVSAAVAHYLFQAGQDGGGGLQLAVVSGREPEQEAPKEKNYRQVGAQTDRQRRCKGLYSRVLWGPTSSLQCEVSLCNRVKAHSSLSNADSAQVGIAP